MIQRLSFFCENRPFGLLRAEGLGGLGFRSKKASRLANIRT